MYQSFLIPRGRAVVFFGIPGETRFDLRFWLFGVHVRVHPMHWVVSAFLGWGWFSAPGKLLTLPLWLFAVFFSVLVHEMGHVMMGRLFGTHGHILLYGMGGLAIGSNGMDKRWQRILVSFAGPLAQFVLYGMLRAGGFFLLPFLPENLFGYHVLVLYTMLLIINLFWPILNLLPIWPLDGGMITREVLEGFFRQKGVIASLWISLIVSGLIALQVVLNIYDHRHPLIPFVSRLVGDDVFFAMFFAMFAVTSYQALQQERTRYSRWDDELPWER